MSEKVGAYARVTLKLEIDVGQGWGDNCEVSQIYRQAEAAAREMIVTGKLTAHNARVLGRPVVDAIIARH